MRLIEGQKPGSATAAPSPDAMAELASMAQSVVKYEESAATANTRLAKAKQWEAFEAWCRSKGMQRPASPETLALYLPACLDAGLSVATLAVAKAAISQRHDHAVAVALKRSAAAAGFSVEPISGRSLRAGFVTSAKMRGADDAAITVQTGHTSRDMLQRYHRRAKKWVKPASEKLGL